MVCFRVNNTFILLGLFNPLNAKLNPICHLLALLGAHTILHVSRIRVNYRDKFIYTSNSTGNRLLYSGYWVVS